MKRHINKQSSILSFFGEKAQRKKKNVSWFIIVGKTNSRWCDLNARPLCSLTLWKKKYTHTAHTTALLVSLLQAGQVVMLNRTIYLVWCGQSLFSSFGRSGDICSTSKVSAAIHCAVQLQRGEKMIAQQLRAALTLSAGKAQIFKPTVRSIVTGCTLEDPLLPAQHTPARAS